MDVMLWKVRIKPGKQSLAKKWVDFPRVNREEGEKMLKNEKGHLEVYFMQQENEAAYLYPFVLADDLGYANQVAQSSGNPLDTKHLRYMMACINPKDCAQLKPEPTLGDMGIFT